MQVYIPKKISYDVIEWCKKGRGDEQIHRWSMNEVNKNFDGQKSWQEARLITHER